MPIVALQLQLFGHNATKHAVVSVTKDQLKKIFISYDTNGDGVLSRDEVLKAFEYLGSRWPSYRACFGTKHADANGDGVVDCSTELDALVDYAFQIQYKLVPNK